MADLQKIVNELSELTVSEAAALAKMLEQKWGDAGQSQQKLFEARHRVRQAPLQRGENLYNFYDACGSAGYDELRALVNGWLANVDIDGRSELISRMRYGKNREFSASLSELMIHAFLCGSGHQVKVHPGVPNSSKRPDFAAITEASPLAYIEVTTVNPPAAQEAEVNRENPIYLAIDGATLPAGSILGYQLIRAGRDSPPLRPLVREVEQWARENSELAKAEKVSRNFSLGEWIVQLDLYSGGSNPEPATRAIGIAQSRGGIINPHEDLRGALEEKSDRYGVLDKPYLIVVADGKDQFFNEDAVYAALREAVFGDEVVQFRGGTTSLVHATNGFWHGARGPRNQQVSGVLLLPATGLWTLRQEKCAPILAINPWAQRPLPESLRVMRLFEMAGDHWVLRDGKPFADIVGIPNPWPPAE